MPVVHFTVFFYFYLFHHCTWYLNQFSFYLYYIASLRSLEVFFMWIKHYSFQNLSFLFIHLFSCWHVDDIKRDTLDCNLKKGKRKTETTTERMDLMAMAILLVLMGDRHGLFNVISWYMLPRRWDATLTGDWFHETDNEFRGWEITFSNATDLKLRGRERK
jgi:hypothetical protein